MIQLTPEEMSIAASAGCDRIIDNIKHGRKKIPNNCPDEQIWNDAVEGAMAEMALCKLWGKEWDAGFKGSLDVGEYDVRSTKYKNGSLLLQKWDNNRINILITGSFGKYNVVGYLYNPYGQVNKYWRAEEKRPCFWIPQKDLVPYTNMKDLEKYKHQCAVRQLLIYYKEMGSQAYAKYCLDKAIDPWLREEVRDQYKKGNKGEKDDWRE